VSHATTPVRIPTPVTVDDARLARERWFLLALLMSSVAINYIDRGNLSVAATRIAAEFNIKGRQRGSSAFVFLLDLRHVSDRRRLAD
jgi:hypothetical protein